jgi:hypothetical protein
MQLAHERKDIRAEPVLVRLRMARFVDSAVNGAAQMLQERAEKPIIRMGNFKVLCIIE